MGDFSISFTGHMTDYDPLVAVGEIQLGGHHEYFHATLEYWSIEDYEVSWVRALRRLVAGAPVSCLVTGMVDPEHANFEEVWTLYRSGDDLYVQNHLVFLDQLDHKFNEDAPWESVHPRETVNEDGRKISEWALHVEDIREFIDAKRPT